MHEVLVSPEEFLSQMLQSDSWMPESDENDVPEMYIRRGDTRIRVVVENYSSMDISAQIAFQQRLKLLRTAPEVSMKRRY